MRHNLLLALVFGVGLSAGWLIRHYRNTERDDAIRPPLPSEHLRCPNNCDDDEFLVTLTQKDKKTGVISYERHITVDTAKRQALLLTWGVPVDEGVAVSPTK